MMNRCYQTIKHKRGPLLAGLLVGTTYIPFPPWALLFCYVPLWLHVIDERRTTKQAFWSGWCTQFLLTLIGFHWIAYTAHEFGSMPWVVSVPIVLIFSSIVHIYIPLAIATVVALKKKFSLGPVPSLFLLALVQSFFERIWPSIFPWHLGYTLLWAKLPAYHLADVVGFEGLSTWILLFNAWVAYIWLKQAELKKVFIHLGCLFALLCGLMIWGQTRKQEWTHFDAELKVAIVQANIGNLEKVFAEKGRGYQTSITQKFLDLSQKAVAAFPDTQVLMWPETAYPDYLDPNYLNRVNQRQLIAGLMPMQKALLTGAYSKEEKMDPRNDHATYNALFLISPEGQSYSPPYRKTYLLAFGEYLPLSETFPSLLKLLPFIANFGRGQGPALLKLPQGSDEVKIGGQICYEGLYPDFSEGLAKVGAEIIANVTNDSWFGQPSEPRQHLYMTLARGIETRRPLIRATNTGISTAILADGEILQQSPLHQEWFGQFVIPYRKNPPLTFFVEYGHWDWVLWLAVSLGLLATRRRRKEGTDEK